MQPAHANREAEPVTEASHPHSEPVLRIAGIDPERGFSGGETQVLGLTLALSRAGHRADLVCDPAGALWERARAAGIRCHALAIRNALDLSAGMRLRAILRREHYDVVHFHTSRAHAMAPLARGHARALVVTRRMDYRPNRLFAPYLFGRAVDGVIAISSGVADSMVQAGAARERITIVPSGVDCDHYRPPSAAERERARAALGIGSATIAIAAVGALEPRKGHRYLIEAFATLTQAASQSPDLKRLKCLIAGSGPARAELERKIAELGCAGQISLAGQIEDARQLLWAADIFVMPSLSEGLGVAALEAMACGLPVIASGVGGLGETVVDGRTGIITGAARPDEIASAIARLAGSPELVTAMGAAGRARAADNYSMAAMAERTLALYRKSLGQPVEAGTD